jgi:hypothetical protein
MKAFFNYINLLPNGNLEEQYNLFATKGLEDPRWAFKNIIRFLQYHNIKRNNNNLIPSYIYV